MSHAARVEKTVQDPPASVALISVLTSFAISMTLIPAVAGYVIPTERDHADRRWWREGCSNARLTALCRHSLGRTLRTPAIGVAVSVLPPLVGFAVVGTLPEMCFPPNDRNQFLLQMSLPSQCSIEETRSNAPHARDVLHAHAEVVDSRWLLGEARIAGVRLPDIAAQPNAARRDRAVTTRWSAERRMVYAAIVRWHTYALIALTVALLLFVSRGGNDLPPGEIQGDMTPVPVIDARRAQQLAADLGVGGDGARQILFGDLHVHTTYSIDAFLYALPIFGEGNTAYPPAFACDFARHCSALDFFSINDHAEGITPERWQATIDTLRSCEARAGDPSNPDLIPFLGWEWTQVGATPEDHWGHKNVVLRGLGDDEITPRPIAFRPASDQARAPADWQLALGESAASFAGTDYANFMWWLRRLLAMPVCAKGVPSPLLPDDCLESADTPAELFAKLDEWDRESIVIPHGLAWGIHAPPGARLDNQLNAEQHDPARQTLLEVFSGHGSSEEYRPRHDRPESGSGAEVCEEPTPDFLPCCWRAGEIMRERCGDLPADECEARVARARQLALEAGLAPHHVFPDTTPEDWLDCDECRDCFKPAGTLRAGETAQYSLAISRFDADGGDPQRFRWGFIGSSDNHRARSSTGYKQILRSEMADTRGVPSAELEARVQGLIKDPDVDPLEPQPVEVNPRSFAALFDNERQASFMYPGGLVAVHSAGRNRAALWDGLKRREVYATSGPRILLWFDLLNGPGGRAPMGSEVALGEAPRFEVRAVGSFVQKPGCPEHTLSGVDAERLQDLCMGECYHPGDRRHPIEAIEVVRVRPPMTATDSTPLAQRIEDPWRRLPCPADGSGCVVHFEDDEYAAHGGDAVYYVRALQAPTPAINGANLRVELDADGRALRTRPCHGSYKTPAEDDCLAPVSERAWSSPIFVDRVRASGP